MRFRNCVKLKTVFFCCLCLLLKTSMLYAQLYTPIVPLRFTGMGGSVTFGLEREFDFRENPNSDRPFEDKDNSWFEELSLGVDGYVYHPYLLEFRADTNLNFNQESNSSNASIQSDLKENYLDYNLALRMLKARPVSLNLNTSRATQETNSSFVESQRVTTDQNTAFVTYKNRILPTVVGFTTTKSIGQGLNKTRDRSDLFHVDITNRGALGSSEFHYKNEDLSQSVGNLDQETDEFNFSNDLRFGPQRHQRFDSRYQWRNQKGTFAVKNILWSEDLHLRHTEHLNTFYQFNFQSLRLKSSQGALSQVGQTSTNTQYRAGLSHQLFESLFTAVELQSEHEGINQSDIDTKLVNLSLNYHKRIPIGALSLNYTTSVTDEDQQFEEDRVQISEEKHTFENTPGATILLVQDLIDTDSIVLKDQNGLLITDPDTGIPIEEGIHYRVDTIGVRTEIRLLPVEGDFLEGQEVFVDYVFQTSPPIKFRTFSKTYGVRLDIKKFWSLYYSGGRTDQLLKGGIDLNRLEDTIDRRFGSQVRWKNSVTLVERQVHRSKFSPYLRTTLSETVDFRLNRYSFYRPRLYLNASYTGSNTFEEADQTIDRSYSIRLLMRLPYQIKWDTRALYQNLDLVGDKEIDVEFATNLHWRYRSLVMILSYENIHQRFEITGKEKHRRLFLKAQRFFGKRRKG